MDGPSIESFRRLPDDVLAMPGFAYSDSARTLEALLCIMHLNSDELLRWLARTDDVEILVAVWGNADTQEFENHLDETERLLFNYLAGVHARVAYYQGLKNRDGH